jgi:hypothetical protein
MAKRQTVVVPDYPSILLTPIDWSSGAVFDKLVDALLAHYKLAPLPPPSGPLFDPATDHELDKRMASLAFCLMQDFVPAFQKPRKVGAPKQDHTRKEWLFPSAHEARLVQIVGALRELLAKKNLPSTNKAAYEELVRILRKNPAPHWRYGKLRKASAFAQAWKLIPKDVKDNPDSHFPARLPQIAPMPPAPDFDAMGSLTGPKVWAATQYMAVYFRHSALERLSQILPSVPSELTGSRT